jgi:hypothetical protein
MGSGLRVVQILADELWCPAIDQHGSLMGFNSDIGMPMEGSLVPDAGRNIPTRLAGRR